MIFPIAIIAHFRGSGRGKKRNFIKQILQTIKTLIVYIKQYTIFSGLWQSYPLCLQDEDGIKLLFFQNRYIIHLIG